MLDMYRKWFKGIEIIVADVFAVLPFTPNQYTSFSVIAALAMFYFVIAGQYIAALGFFLVSAGLDFVDGAVARRKGLSTNKGAYWDTIADRYVEAIFLLAMLFVNLPFFYLPAYVWIFLILIGSLMTTYAKAAAREKCLLDVELKGGIMSRAERLIILLMVLVSLGFYPWCAVYLLAFLAVFSNITALQRIIMAIQKK